MKIYLCGPINGCNDSECKDWRNEVKNHYPNDTFDPMSRDYRGKEDLDYIQIVEQDKLDIDACSILLVKYDKPSVGTSMEVLYAWEQFKLIIIVIENKDTVISPWLRYHSSFITNSFEEAYEYIEAASNKRKEIE